MIHTTLGVRYLIGLVKGRTIGISVAVALGLTLAGGGAWYGIAKLRERPPHDLVVTYRRHATTLDNDDRLANQTAKTLATKSPRLKRIRSEATRDRVRIECSFDSKPVDYDDDKRTIKNAAEQVLHGLDMEEAPPEIEDAEPQARMWILAKKDLYAALDEIRGVTVWHGCGAAPAKRFRVQLNPAKLAAYKVDITDFVLNIEHEVAEGGIDAFPLSRLVNYPVNVSVRLSQVANIVAWDDRPPPCTALDADGGSVIALRAKLHPKTLAEDRGKFDAVIKDANATLIGEKDFSEVRFFPTEGGTIAQQLVLERTVFASAKAQFPVLAIAMTNEGVGTLLVKREVKDDAIRSFFGQTPTTSWGGIRGRRYLQVTSQDRDRNVADRQAQNLEKKVSAIDGVGARILIAPPTRVQFTYNIDDEKALHEAVEIDLLRALLPLDAEQDSTLPVIFDAPLDALTLRGRPFASYVSTRTTMAAPRLVRINAVPAVELRWEITDVKTVKHVRQVVGDSGTVDDVPAAL